MAGDERPEEDVPTALRRSRAWAVAAFLLLLTALWLPWWTVRYEDDAGVSYESTGYRVFDPEPPVTRESVAHATGALAVAAAGWLFVRLAGRSHAYEPRAWRRDLAAQGVLVLAAVASVGWWPDGVPRFWGGRTFRIGDATFTETSMPGLGWWLAALALAALAVAAWTARAGGDRLDPSP